MRKSIQYLVEDGADKGKVFILTRMSAFSADKWARHLVKALAEAGERLLESILKYPVKDMTELALILFGKIALNDLERSFDSLLGCCKIQDPKTKELRHIISEDIEDPMTLTNLRSKVFEMHKDYLRASYQQLMPLNVLFELSDERK